MSKGTVKQPRLHAAIQAIVNAESAIDRMRTLATARQFDADLSDDELDGMNFCVQSARKALELIAGNCTAGDARPSGNPHAGAIAALTQAVGLLVEARPLYPKHRRTFFGALFTLECVLAVLDANLPTDSPLSLRLATAGRPT